MLSQVVISPFIHKLNNLIRIFSASSFFTLSVISFLLTFFGDFKKFIGGLEPLRDSLFRMYLLSHTRVLSISKRVGSGLHLLSRLPIALYSLASAMNFTVGFLKFAKIWDLEICRDRRNVLVFFSFKPASGR